MGSSMAFSSSIGMVTYSSQYHTISSLFALLQLTAYKLYPTNCKQIIIIILLLYVLKTDGSQFSLPHKKESLKQ